MRSLTCIVCPMGCQLTVDETPDGELRVSGNRCPRGAVYALEEIKAPKRVVTATCRVSMECDDTALGETKGSEGYRALCEPRRVPVKTNSPCPKERIPELLTDIYKLNLKRPIKSGTMVIKDWKGLGIDVIALRALD